MRHDNGAATSHLLVTACMVVVPMGVNEKLNGINSQSRDRLLHHLVLRRVLVVDYVGSVGPGRNCDITATAHEHVNTIGDHDRFDWHSILRARMAD